MTWRDKLTIRILLLVARMVAPSAFADDVRHLQNHIALLRTDDDND